MVTLKPNSPPQEAFLATPADIAIYGGSAGGGKSWALLLEPLRHMHNPEFGAVIFRRTSPQVTNEGGLWDEAGKLYPPLGGMPRVGDLEYLFEPGSRVAFRHLQHEKNKYDWQGAQVPFFGFDELTHFSESQFFYMLSRNRSTCGVRPYVRGTTNPDASSWVKRFLAPWVDRKFPDPARSGEIRWFVRVNGELVWSRTREQLKADFPQLDPKSVTFVRASIYDNKDLLAKDPGYLANLQAQDPVEKARLLDGNWDVVNEGLVYPDFGQAVVEPKDFPANLTGDRYGGIDWGFNNPFAALGAILDSEDVLWVHWERYATRTTLTAHSKAMPRDGTRWFADPAGADQVAELRAADHDVVSCTHAGSTPLASGIAAVTERLRSGRLKILGSLGNLIDEAGKYRYENKSQKPEGKTEKPVDCDNHALAALRYMVVGIDRYRVVKDAAPPEPPEAQVARLKEAQRLKSEEWHSLDNEAWWN